MQHRRLVESEVDERREQKRASKEGDPRKKMAAAAAMAMKDPSLWHKVAAISGNPPSPSSPLQSSSSSSSCFPKLAIGWLDLSRGCCPWTWHLWRAHVPPQEPRVQGGTRIAPRCSSLPDYSFYFRPFCYNLLIRFLQFGGKKWRQVWHTASLYHLVHTAALLGAPITKRPDVVSILAIHTAVYFAS